MSLKSVLLWLGMAALLLTACDVTPPATALPATALPATATTAPAPIEESPADSSPVRGAPVDGDVARQHLVALAEEIGARLPGSEEEAAAAEYIQSAFSGFGYEPEVQPFTFTDEDEEELESANVIVVKPGESAQEIIIGAHYDSVDDADGADDNASGVAVLLTAAEMLYDTPTPYTLRFIAFGAEEVDLNGSRFYVEQLSRSARKNIVAMVNLDSLIAGDIVYVYGDAGAGSLRDWIIADAAESDIELEARLAEELDEEDGTPCECADYGPFQEAGIPFAYFEATNWDLNEDGMTQVDPEYGEDGAIRHTEYDTVEYIDETFPGRVDEHLVDFTTLLVNALTQYTVIR